MSLAQILGHLKAGDPIIIRSADQALLRLRQQLLPARTVSSGGGAPKSRRLLRTLIAVRRDGKE